jgi:hypothetical protein
MSNVKRFLFPNPQGRDIISRRAASGGFIMIAMFDDPFVVWALC